MASFDPLEKVNAMKEAGNAAFAEKQYSVAIDQYSLALSLCPSPSSPRQSSSPSSTSGLQLLRCTLLSNRAASYLSSSQPSLCLSDCSAALDLLSSLSATPSSPAAALASLRCKLLYRRACCLRSSSDYDAAIKDALAAVSIDAGNKAALDLVRDLREKLQVKARVEGGNRTPLSSTLASLRSSSAAAWSSLAAVPIVGPSATSAKALPELCACLRGLLSLLSDSDADASGAAAELGSSGGFAALELGVFGPALKAAAAQDEAGAEGGAARTGKVEDDGGRRRGAAPTTTTNPKALDACVLAVQVLAAAFKHKAFAAAAKCSAQDVERMFSTADATVPTAICDRLRPARLALAATILTSGNLKTGSESLSAALVSFLNASLPPANLAEPQLPPSSPVTAASSPDIFGPLSQCLHLASLLTSVAVVGKEQARSNSSALFRDGAAAKLLLLAVVARGAKAAKGGNETKDTGADGTSVRREVQVALGRCAKNFDGDEAAEEELKNLVSPALQQAGEGMHNREKKCIMTTSLLIGAPNVGVWALTTGWCSSAGKPGDGVPSLLELSSLSYDSDSETLESGDKSCSSSHALSLAADVVCAAANADVGRGVLSPLFESGAIGNMLSSSDADTRSAAASTMAKVGMSAKALKAGAPETTELLEVSLRLLDDPLSRTSCSPPVERAVEVLAYLSSRTAVKEQLCSDPDRCLMRIKDVAIETDINFRAPATAYAVATLYATLTVSVEELRKEAFADKEITPEQYEQMQKLTKLKGEKDDEKEESDSPAAVNKRIAKVVKCGGVQALCALLPTASPATKQQCISALSRLAACPAVRGAMIQGGALSACLALAGSKKKGVAATEDREADKEKEDIALKATHCVAKMLVTMNPMMLTETQRMGSITPLVNACREHASTNLLQFESCLALTNLASVGDETKDKIVAEGGVLHIGYLMFSEHELVRRSATECMSNLIPHPSLLSYFLQPEKVKVWVSFMRDFESDLETSRAAAGGLAMASMDPAVAAAIARDEGAGDGILEICKSGNVQLMHRGLVLAKNLILAGDEENGPKGVKEMLKDKKVLEFVALWSERGALLCHKPVEEGGVGVEGLPLVEIASKIVDMVGAKGK